MNDELLPHERPPGDYTELWRAAPALYAALCALVKAVVDGNSSADLDAALGMADDALLEAQGRSPDA